MRAAEHRQSLLKKASEIDEQLCHTDICNPKYGRLLIEYDETCRAFARVVGTI